MDIPAGYVPVGSGSSDVLSACRPRTPHQVGVAGPVLASPHCVNVPGKGGWLVSAPGRTGLGGGRHQHPATRWGEVSKLQKIRKIRTIVLSSALAVGLVTLAADVAAAARF